MNFISLHFVTEYIVILCKWCKFFVLSIEYILKNLKCMKIHKIFLIKVITRPSLNHMSNNGDLEFFLLLT